jgi:hypothetical protein
MRHVSCDFCGKDLLAEEEPRYVVRMESQYIDAAPTDLTEEDLDDQVDDDSVEMMVELLGTEADDEPQLPAKPMAKEYDFCDACYRRFQSDPLGLERARNLQFSAN